jgi:hypothetical protein
MQLQRFIFALTLPALIFVSGCNHAPAGGLPTTKMQIGNTTFTLEIATSDHDMHVGLMHRENLDSDHGMIFSYPDEDVRTFWNHDVHFPLDLLFLDHAGTLVSIRHMKSYSDLNVSSDKSAEYCIELNDGTAQKLKLSEGQQLQIPAEAKAPVAAR